VHLAAALVGPPDPAWYAEDGTPFVGPHVRGGAQPSHRRRQDHHARNRAIPTCSTPGSPRRWCRSPRSAGRTKATFERERRFYLPSTVLVTGFDIIFFWVARMIMTSLQFAGVTAFEDVYINAIVRDAEGNKMSKSKGNTIDPLDVIDGIDFAALLEKSTQGLMLAAHKEAATRRIKRDYPEGITSYGADALRFTFASLPRSGARSTST
jgi:valyl-tRNA synthetase